MGLDYELINMQFPPRATYPGYLELNPLGTVPTFTDGDLVMTESSGICQYLEDMYGPTSIGVAKDHPAYGEYLNWLYRSDATLTFPQTLVLRYTRLEPEERRILSRRGLFDLVPVTFALGRNGFGWQRVFVRGQIYCRGHHSRLCPVPWRFARSGCSLQTQLQALS